MAGVSGKERGPRGRPHRGTGVTDDAEETGPKTARRRPGGKPFQPGQSGNPAGRPAGSRNRATIVLEALVDKSGPKLIRKAIKMAMEGDASVMRALLPLLLPGRRERPIEFALPPIETAADALLASRLILAGAANGAITPTEAAELGKLVELHAKLTEVVDLESRIAELERERGIGLSEGAAIQ
jgi:Family of unknown function (DUF5681)